VTVGRSSTRRRSPSSRLERSLMSDGFTQVAGLDEVGRGAWAGPVSVGVVVHSFASRPPRGIRDSKQLTEPQREELFPRVARWCTEWAVGHASPQECDAHGMTVALRLASHRALAELSVTPDVLLVDGAFDYVTEPAPEDRGPPELPLGVLAADAAPAGGRAAAQASQWETAPVRDVAVPPVRTVVKGDVTCLSVAAASIMAKVTRDRLMRAWSESFPPFDFDQNKGYPSPAHKLALSGFGLTSIHRRSWAFVDHLVYRQGYRRH
jgi:ribonuclease HII